MMSGSAVQAADIIIIGFLVISGIAGIICGFTRLLLNICAWGASIWFSIYASPYIQPFFSQFITHPLGAQIASSALVFVVSLSLLIYISSSLSTSVKSSSFSGLDRGLGMLLGVGLGTFLFSVLFSFATVMLSKPVYAALVHETRLGEFFESCAKTTTGIFQDYYLKNISGLISKDTALQGVQDKAQELSKPVENAVKSVGNQAQEQLTKLIQEELESKTAPLEPAATVPQKSEPTQTVPAQQ
jgi:uncharacterized membrane protein required for colicin V production